MNEEYFNLGPCPCSEDCAQVGSEGYESRTRKEGAAYIGQLRRMYPDMPEGVRFELRGFPHDFGTYHEVVVVFDPDNPEHSAYACDVEGGTPEFWDDEAKQQLI